LATDKSRQAQKRAIYINAVIAKKHGHRGRENAQKIIKLKPNKINNISGMNKESQILIRVLLTDLISVKENNSLLIPST
jgi:hypothetical protein